MTTTVYADREIEEYRAERLRELKLTTQRDRRERIASAQQAALLANSSTVFDYRDAEHRRQIADIALSMADALIAALDAEAGDGE